MAMATDEASTRVSYQVSLAREVRRVVDVPVVAGGLITGYDQAEMIIGTGDADMVVLARTILFDPNWPWRAAAALGVKFVCQSSIFARSPIWISGCRALQFPLRSRIALREFLSCPDATCPCSVSCREV